MPIPRKWKKCCEEQPTIDPETGRYQNGCGPINTPRKATHTPMPWKTDLYKDVIEIWSNGILIGEIKRPQDASLIVHRVNMFDELVKALKKEHDENMDQYGREHRGGNYNPDCLTCATLARATGEKTK